MKKILSRVPAGDCGIASFGGARRDLPGGLSPIRSLRKPAASGENGTKHLAIARCMMGPA